MTGQIDTSNPLERENTLLVRLVDRGEKALRGERGSAAELAELAAAVMTLMARPSDGVRIVSKTTHIYTLALSALCAALWDGNPKEAAPFARVVGVLLPDMRADFGRAIEKSKRPTA